MIIVHILALGGISNLSIPVKCSTKNPGHSNKTFKSPTSPKNMGMLTRLSSPILFFMNTAYSPYMTALINAMPSPIATSEILLCGKLPLFSSLDPDRSTLLISAMPVSEAHTPSSFRSVKRSTRNRVPKSRVKTLEVDVRIVDEATVVYSRQAATK